VRRLRVAVIVLGDLARSPRMLYHTRALADGVADVDLVGYVETPLEELGDHVRVHALRTPARIGRALFALRGLARVVRQTIELVRTVLVRLDRFDVLLVQNPPALPTLLVGVVAARARGARLVVDWHNFGWAMLAVKIGPDHVATRLARRVEHWLARRANAHLCVSRAMQSELATRWGVPGAVVLHDRPASQFVATPPDARRALLARLHDALRVPDLPGPPALLVSPSSWTPDEDFGLLLEAAERYDAAIGSDATLPDLLVVATGDGPLRDHYAHAMSQRGLRRVHLRTLWLDAADYALLVGAADLGLCFHRSTSGVDLPMKIADFLGAGVPVCALDYGPCLGEVLEHGRNGLLFGTAEELARQLLELFRGWPAQAPLLAHLRENVGRATGERWDDAWKAAALPLFLAR